MNAHLHKAVFRARTEFEMNTGKKPTRLLLGKREIRWLQSIAKDMMTTVVTVPGPSRSEYMGLPVYEMDDEEFLGVA